MRRLICGTINVIRQTRPDRVGSGLQRQMGATGASLCLSIKRPIPALVSCKTRSIQSLTFMAIILKAGKCRISSICRASILGCVSGNSAVMADSRRTPCSIPCLPCSPGSLGRKRTGHKAPDAGPSRRPSAGD